MKRARKPGSIRTRITGGFLMVLVLVFAVICISFNLIVDAYIRTQATQQLSLATENVLRDILGEKRIAPFRQQGLRAIVQEINNTVRRATFFSSVQALIINKDYELIFPSQESQASRPSERYTGKGRNSASEAQDAQADSDAAMKDSDSLELEEKQAVFGAIKLHEVDISSTSMHRLSEAGRSYYIISLPLTVTESASRSSISDYYYLVLYLDITDASLLATTINWVLTFVILASAALAGVLSFIMSARITRPIRELSSFAAAIGRGDFARRELAIRDRELIELGDTMNHAAEQLESYDKEQKTFFQNASHELRTPLMSIRGYAEGIKVGVFDDNADAAQIIMSESDHLTHMVEDLLYLSKIDNITQSNRISSFDIRELLSNCGESLKGIALHEGKRIEYDFPEDPVTVTGSEQTLERAFVNILANGLRYARGVVRVHCAQTGATVTVSIEDDGPGIVPEELPHIFNRFYKGRGGKHGIGLSISKAVITQHHGEIRAENTGGGAKFVVELPAEAP